VPFELRNLFKVIDILKYHEIPPSQLFSSCDADNNGKVEVKEVLKFIRGIYPEFKTKEAQSLMRFLDLDKNGMIDRDEFQRQFGRAEMQYKNFGVSAGSTGFRVGSSMGQSASVRFMTPIKGGSRPASTLKTTT